VHSTKPDTRNGGFFAIKMSKTSGLAEELYRVVVGVSGPEIRQDFSSE